MVLPPAEITLDDKKMKVPNPEHVRMVAKQQQVLNYLLSSLSHELLQQQRCMVLLQKSGSISRPASNLSRVHV
jgi:hypothetical protein